jgi:hypothetical protein
MPRLRLPMREEAICALDSDMEAQMRDAAPVRPAPIS